MKEAAITNGGPGETYAEMARRAIENSNGELVLTLPQVLPDEKISPRPAPLVSEERWDHPGADRSLRSEQSRALEAKERRTVGENEECPLPLSGQIEEGRLRFGENIEFRQRSHRQRQNRLQHHLFSP